MALLMMFSETDEIVTCSIQVLLLTEVKNYLHQELQILLRSSLQGEKKSFKELEIFTPHNHVL